MGDGTTARGEGTVGLADGPIPLYQRISGLIERRIAEGAYPVGSMLPTENELAAELEVSRQTVRLAIAQLRKRGRLSARKGVGTWVEAQEEDWRSRFFARSRAELFDFARETELHIKVRETVEARGRLAVEMGVRPGKKWAYFAGPRFYAGEAEPFCYNEVYLERHLAPILRDVAILRQSLFLLVEQTTGDRIEEIVQEIRSVQLDGVRAETLSVPPGSLALKLSRRYYGSGRRLLEYAVQSHPADRFVYRTVLRSS